MAFDTPCSHFLSSFGPAVRDHSAFILAFWPNFSLDFFPFRAAEYQLSCPKTIATG
jgi:hypothetical protein